MKVKGIIVMMVFVMVMSLSSGVLAQGNGAKRGPTITDTVVSTASADNPEFTILLAALQQAELGGVLDGKRQFTVFAPTDAAFANLLEALNVTPEQLLTNPDLASILLYHVVPGRINASDLEDGMLLRTINGQKIKISLGETAKVNDSTIVKADISASNGVIHVIDAVLIPE
ncbi:putative surface protein with fasciclin (FAS1) repeats [Bacillus mesophilus]|uniref:Fasciclin domain-containing protein n=1 Tax=Bacillus mesophilus TaxID=1808955 RepID=A0A6M0QAV7_9BACI|nr:fasciclin domain-containing protein [Bacillus mesophilus]MBM7662843.1 putative surface protein with fasciclin (FAS1) repeats [Bacillus mesophilus]NEY73433.1 fasciclin domain-containing protein [Bacillus mesophilus]